MDQAAALFAAIAEPMVETLPESERALERARLFGSAISVGLADVLLDLEATRTSADATERWLEYRLEGTFALGGDSPIPLRGVADRIDLLPGRRLRVIDYKSGAVPSASRALQAPVYALCAQERLGARDGAPWTIEEASYVSLGGRRAVTSVVAPDDTPAEASACLEDSRARLFALRSALERGIFPPRPYDTIICRSCAFSSVCRKDYAGDE
jgi:RecB family exonuclease